MTLVTLENKKLEKPMKKLQIKREISYFRLQFRTFYQ